MRASSDIEQMRQSESKGDGGDVRTTILCYSTFDKKTRRGIMFLIALAGFFSPLSANIYFPALNYIAADLKVSPESMNLTITAYLICQGLVPFIVGDLADNLGRRPVYIAVFVVYLAANLGLALQRSYPALLALRILQSSGSSGTITLAISVVSDIAPPHQRGKYVGAALCGPNTAPSIGPVLGGVLAERAGWPWIFWFLAILSGVSILMILVFLPETARKVVGNGSVEPPTINKSLISTLRQPSRGESCNTERKRSAFRLPNPLGCLRIICHKDTCLVLIPNAIFYMNYNCMQASLSPLLMRTYGLNALQVGLTYLPYGIGCGLASYAAGKIIDRDYQKIATSAGIVIDRAKGDDLSKFPIEKARLRSIWYFIIISTLCTIGYGWALHSHIAIPLTLQIICGLTVTGTFNVCNTLIVDIHPDCPATASSSASLVRCSVAAVGVSLLQYLLDHLGPGWTFTIFGALGIITAPMLASVWLWGMQWRTARNDEAEENRADIDVGNKSIPGKSDQKEGKL